MHHHKPVIAAAVGLTLIAALAGCASGSKKAEGSPSPTPSATSAQYNRCVDGTARILASELPKNRPFSLDCPTVSVVGAATDGSSIELGALEKLVVEGDDATVRADSAEKVIVPGSHNTITVTGKSDVEDLGEGNTITVG